MYAEVKRNSNGVLLTSWFYLVMAIFFEVSGTTFMKLSEGFTKTLPSILMVVFYAISLGLLTLALKKIDVSIAYAIWAGLGTMLIATIGILWLKEPVSALKVISLGLVIVGVVGLHLSSGMHQV